MSVKNRDYRHIYLEHSHRVVEKTQAQALLLFLYTTTIGAMLRPIIRLRILSILYGWYQSSWLSRRRIAPFITKHAIAMEECIVPAGGYRSFNDFFCRKLKPDARPLDTDVAAILSPADAKCWAITDISDHATFFVKQQQFTLRSFLRDEALANYFEGGSLLVLRLAPYDYHRFHAVTTGEYSKPRPLGGTLESVNPIAFKYGCMPLVENKRHIISIQSQVHNCMLAMIPVGAMFVGKIAYSAQLPGILTAGDELGYFAFGGSTVVVLVPRGHFRVRADLAAYTARGFEVSIKMGESLGRFIA